MFIDGKWRAHLLPGVMFERKQHQVVFLELCGKVLKSSGVRVHIFISSGFMVHSFVYLRQSRGQQVLYIPIAVSEVKAILSSLCIVERHYSGLFAGYSSHLPGNFVLLAGSRYPDQPFAEMIHIVMPYTRRGEEDILHHEKIEP